MRIRENIYDGHEAYPCELREQVRAVFNYTFQIIEIKSLLTDIKREALRMRKLFWTEEELKEKREAAAFFDARMQATVYYTLKNLDGYQQHGWRKLVDEGGGGGDEKDDSVSKNS